MVKQGITVQTVYLSKNGEMSVGIYLSLKVIRELYVFGVPMNNKISLAGNFNLF